MESPGEYKQCIARWSDWSGWILHPEYPRYYRVRQNVGGEYDYQWDNPSASHKGEELECDRHISRKADDSEASRSSVPQDATITALGPYSEPASNYDKYSDEPTLLHDRNLPVQPDESLVGLTDEELHEKYQEEPSSRFQAGKIFTIYWSEPRSASPLMPSMEGRVERVNNLGQLVHTGSRRFIVVANDQSHCTCIPILTYKNNASPKLKKLDRLGIIHDERKKPYRLHKEPELGFKPIRAIMTEPLETLARESRVNYSMLSTIEHNCSVRFIGEVHPDDAYIFQRAFAKCWAKKDARHRRA